MNSLHANNVVVAIAGRTEISWNLDHLHASRLTPPTTDELALPRLFDPEGYFLADKSVQEKN